MKKIRLMILLCLIVNSLKAELITLNLVQFANMVSNQNNITVLIDESLKENVFAFAVNSNKDYSLTAFRKALSLNDLQLAKTESFYYVEPKSVYAEIPKYRAINLNFVRFKDIKNFLEVYEDNISFQFIKTSKILLLKSNAKDYKSIYNLLKTIDTLPTQLKLKVTIIDTNLDKLKELGSDYTDVKIKNNSNFFFNLVSYPFSVKNELEPTETKGFYTFLKFLNTSGTSELISNPVLTLSDENKTIFNVVDNVAYKTGETQINKDDTKTTSAFEYKDVGLQISVTPHIYSQDNVYLDLELNVSNILNNRDNLPTTSKKYIKQSFHLPVGKALVLTGINKKEIITSSKEVPLLSKIPYLEWLFKYESEDINKTNLSVVFELVRG